MSGWRYLLQRLTETGWGEFLHTELPLTNVSITSALTATDELTAEIQPTPGLVDVNGKPLFSEWGTAIWAELDGDILGGGMVTGGNLMGPKWSIQCTGLTGYAYGMPYTDSWFGVEVDPLDVYRHIWAHLQGKPWGNMGLAIPDLKTGLKIGVELEQEEFDTESGPISFEAGPVQLNWYTTHDLGQTISDLAEQTPFEYRERHRWNAAGDNLDHDVELGYPRLGRRLEDMRFVVGENIQEAPQVDRDGGEYASEYLLLGAGSGRTMIRGTASTYTGRARRVFVEEQKDVKFVSQANQLAARKLKTKLIENNIASVRLMNHPSAPVTAVQPGDEIFLQTDGDWEDLSIWCRVQRRTLSPDGDDSAILDLIPSDKVV